MRVPIACASQLYRIRPTEMPMLELLIGQVSVLDLSLKLLVFCYRSASRRDHFLTARPLFYTLFFAVSRVFVQNQPMLFASPVGSPALPASVVQVCQRRNRALKLDFYCSQFCCACQHPPRDVNSPNGAYTLRRDKPWPLRLRWFPRFLAV